MMVNLSSVLSVAFTLAFSAFSSSAPLQRTYLTERQAPAGFLPTGPFLGEFPDPCLIPVNGSWCKLCFDYVLFHNFHELSLI